MSQQGLGIAILILTIIGIFSIIFSFLPQYMSVYKTKNTVAFNKLMFALHWTVALFFLISAALVHIDNSDGLTTARFVLLMGINVFLLFACSHMILIKQKNECHAKKLNISELEHYTDYIQKKN